VSYNIMILLGFWK